MKNKLQQTSARSDKMVSKTGGKLPKARRGKGVCAVSDHAAVVASDRKVVKLWMCLN
jgi:hypothetical protein